jgi:hypothetical protein
MLKSFASYLDKSLFYRELTYIEGESEIERAGVGEGGGGEGLTGMQEALLQG